VGVALDAVRLMTIHRAKGLEFVIVCVADLGRWPRWGAEIVRIARDGRLGLRLARPGTGRREPALAYDAIGEEQREAAAREERRLFYVAATRARERLIFSGAANVESVWGGNAGTAPIGWLGPGLVGELPRAQGDEVLEGVAEGVRYAVAAPGREDPDGGADGEPPAMWEAMAAPAPDPPAEPVMLHPASLSYTSLAQFSRCGYRFYAERVLGLPPVEAGTGGAAAADAAASEPGSLDPAERGTIVHALLERVDFRRPAPGAAEVLAAAGRALAPAQAEEIAGLVEAFSASEVWARLGRAAAVRREQAFAFLLAGTLMTGALDVLAEEPGGGALVVDYKTDRLHGALPAHAVAGGYATQQRVYALAALRAGYERVEVVHVFLERPSEPVSAAFGTADAAWLECELEVLVARVERGEYVVSEAPHRALCHGCPAEGGLCSWPLEMTRRESPASLF
jgi:RecB family exonuclease